MQKKIIILSVLILLATSFMSIGFATLTLSLDITGNINANPQNDIFIVEPVVINTTNVSNNIKINQIYKTILDSTIFLNNSEDNYSITYSITVYNNTQKEYAFKGIISDQGTFDNSQINYTFNGIKLSEIIKKGQSKTFTITLSNSTSSKNELRSFINVAFGKSYSITYNDLTISDGMQLNIAEGLSYTNTFVNPPEDIEVIMAGTKLVKDSDYTYTNGRLYIPNVTGDLILTGKNNSILSEPVIKGADFAAKLKSLANGTIVDGYIFVDTKIKSIKRATEEQYEAVRNTLTSENLIGGNGGHGSVYTWFENDTIYLYTDSQKINMTGNMEKAFSKMSQLSDISALAYFDTSNVTNINRMFQDSTNITDLSPIANWDVSNVTDMSFMFGANVGQTSPESAFMKIASLEPLRNWNVSNVTKMDSMFKGCNKVTSLEAIKDWDVSKVTSFQQMFNRTGLTDARVIKDWNVSRSCNFNMMLANISSLPKANRPIFTSVPGSWNNSGTYIPN